MILSSVCLGVWVFFYLLLFLLLEVTGSVDARISPYFGVSFTSPFCTDMMNLIIQCTVTVLMTTINTYASVSCSA
jgi:hypothetical protein